MSGRRNLRKMLLGIGLMIILALMATSSIHAASAKSKALKAYKELLENKTSLSGNVPSFSLILLDNNSVPELLYNDDPAWYKHSSIYTYKNGKVVEIDNSIRQVFWYVKKKGVLIGSNSSSDGMNYNVNKEYHKLSGTKMVFKAQYTKHSEWNSSKRNYSKNKKNWYYNEKGKGISKSAYNKLIKKMKGSKKELEIKWYGNNAANRQKYLK